MKSIKIRIVLLVLVCAMVSAGVCGGVSMIWMQASVNRNTGEIMSMMCDNSANEVNGILSRVEQSVHTLAQLAKQSLEFNRFKTDAGYVRDYTESLQAAALEFAKNTEGAMTYYIRYNPEFTEPDSGIFGSRSSSRDEFEMLVPTDFSMYDPDDAEHVGWYYIPVRNGRATWMDPYINANINVYMISYVVPIFVDGVSVGIVGMDIAFDQIESFVGGIKAYDTGKAFLVNGANEIVFHDQIAFGTGLSEQGNLASLDAALSDAGRAGTEIVYHYGGEKKICYYAPLNNGMKFVLTAPEKEIHQEGRTLLWSIVLAGGIAVIFSVALGYFLSSGIAGSLKRITEIIKQNAQLNLKPKAGIEKLCGKKDESGDMARAVRDMDERLRNMVLRLEETGKKVFSNAEQIETGSKKVGEMCESNSATTQELAAAMQEAAATAEGINHNIGTVNNNAKEIIAFSESGEKDAEKILARAEGLSHTTQEAAKRTQEMYEQVRKETDAAIEKSRAVEKINELTKSILDISSQTNLLALNASIEAARAGDAGRGFAVVAEEIGTLANQTQDTVKNIDQIIEEVYSAVKGMAACLNSSTNFLEKTVLKEYGEFMEVAGQYASDAGNYRQNMEDITRAIHNLGEAIAAISESSDNISRMTGESAQGISQIAEKTAEIVQEVAEENTLAGMNRESAQGLKEIVDNFVL